MPDEQLRLFVALELPAAVSAELAALQQRMRRTAPPPPVRWVKPANIHLTLQFLGDVDAARAPAILARLHALPAAGDIHLQLALAPVGAFPNLRRPQTIWAGVGGDTAGLVRLQQSVAAALEPLGFPPETRPFHAHLTLGRVRRDAPAADIRALGASIAALPPPSAHTWPAGAPLLFQSTLTPQGPIYTNLSAGLHDD